MLQILTITTPIFILIAIGFLSVSGGMIGRDQIIGMGKFVINLALPALVIKALTRFSTVTTCSPTALVR